LLRFVGNGSRGPVKKRTVRKLPIRGPVTVLAGPERVRGVQTGPVDPLEGTNEPPAMLGNFLGPGVQFGPGGKRRVQAVPGHGKGGYSLDPVPGSRLDPVQPGPGRREAGSSLDPGVAGSSLDPGARLPSQDSTRDPGPDWTRRFWLYPWVQTGPGPDWTRFGCTPVKFRSRLDAAILVVPWVQTGPGPDWTRFGCTPGLSFFLCSFGLVVVV
jgi:hypothetical protein